MKKVTVAPFQSIFDIAIQTSGVADGVADLVEDNALADWEVEAGMELVLRAPKNARIAEWHTETDWTPVSDFEETAGPDFELDFNLDYNS